MQEFCPPQSPYTNELLQQLYKDFIIPEDKELRVKRFLDSGSVHNHFNQERHLYSRSNFKLNRAAALAEWRQLGTA